MVCTLQKITPLKGPFKCDVPRWGYHGVGYTDQRKLTYVMKVYGANVISVTIFQKKLLDNTSTAPISVVNLPVTIQVIRAKIIL